MATERVNPYPGSNFLVDLGTGDTSSIKAGFEEIVLPEVFVDVVEYRNGNEPVPHLRKITTLEHSTNLILKRGVMGALDLYLWWNQVRNGDQSARRNITVQLRDESDENTVLTWRFTNARPVKYRFSNLDAANKNIVLEYLELAVESFELE